MRIKEKTKRRNRRVRTVRSKHKFTILRIAELKVNNLEDVDG
jgi:large subunit ribosomal protein L21